MTGIDSTSRHLGSWLWMGLALVGAVFTVVESPTIESVLFGSMFVAYPAVGLVLRSRVPDNSIGFLLLGVGAVAGLGGIAAALTLLAPPESVAAGVARWMQNWLFYPIIGSVLVLLLVFPGGRLISSRWRWGLWSAGLFVVVASVGSAFYPWPPGEGGPNPLAIETLADTWLFLQEVAGIPLLAAAVAGLLAVVNRYRRGDEVERHQLKWFLAASALLPVAIGVGDTYRHLQGVLVPIAFILFPVTIGLAVLRYRLYDIDRIISRTVSYGLITAVLVGAYAGVVFVLSRALPGQSDLAVAASTLAVAALFNPVRRRVQSLVDRRFNRSRYDSERVIDEFGQRLRSEVGLSDLSEDLVEVAGTTMQPAWTSLWLREEE